MIPRRIELTNFLSFGERQCFEFTDDEAVWVLCGANGVGKSAVFDAITFALFGQHRGGGQNADQLIRHGANSFLVAVEFEFNQCVYHVDRGRDRRAPVQRVRRFVGGGWQDIDLSPFRSRDRIREWAEQTLGLGFEAFTASVMLRQGDADRIITATPRERLDFLRQIIGAERYERLHGRVHSAARRLRAQLDALVADRDRIPEVTPDHLAEVATALQLAADRLNAASANREAAVARVEQARQWNTLEGERACLERQLCEAAARAAEGERIRENHRRFEELERTLPSVSESLSLRARLVEHDTDITRFSSEIATATAARDSAAAAVADQRGRATVCEVRAQNACREAERLREQIDRDRRSQALADEVATLARLLRDIPTDLDVRLAAAEQLAREHGEQQRAAGERRSAAAGLLKAAEKRRRDFDSVMIGAECSRCGQPVSEEHAHRERTELDGEVQCHRTERDAATHDESTATAALAATTAERDQLVNEVRERNRVRDRLHDQRGVLAAQGICADAAVLRAEIEEHTRQAVEFDHAAGEARGEKQKAEAAAAGQEATRVQADARVATLTLRLTTATTRRATDAGRRDTLLDLLPSAWRDRVPVLTDADLHRELADLDRLRASDIRAQFLKLAEDATRRDEWNLRRTALDSAIEQVPADARCSVPSAESLLKTAGERLASAKADHQSAEALDVQRRGYAERRRTLDEQHRTLDLDCRLHDELADLLGAQRLQRDLVRTAEREIVRYANDTVRNLSRGDLTIELDDEDGGPDRAFALRVRRAENPTPIGVVFLSGSQKFRVAVAVALAIGRFASGQARPLESVIIDEGFGSLDRDGLQAMGDELRNLQQCHSLRRLILVSHQEEFVARFPVGYRLEPDNEGTTAVRFRRECGAEV